MFTALRAPPTYLTGAPTIMEDNTAPDTSNFLDWVKIKNFKSIKDLHLDCKRANVFIGKLNVGKSNILEALGILGAEYFEGKFMNGAVRYKNLKHLFYQNDSTNTVTIKTPKHEVADEVKLLGKVLITSAIGSNPDYPCLLTELYTRKAPGILTLKRLVNDLIST